MGWLGRDAFGRDRSAPAPPQATGVPFLLEHPTVSAAQSRRISQSACPSPQAPRLHGDSHLQIQYAVGIALAVIMILLHFATRVAPEFSSSRPSTRCCRATTRCGGSSPAGKRCGVLESSVYDSAPVPAFEVAEAVFVSAAFVARCPTWPTSDRHGNLFVVINPKGNTGRREALE